MAVVEDVEELCGSPMYKAERVLTPPQTPTRTLSMSILSHIAPLSSFLLLAMFNQGREAAGVEQLEEQSVFCLSFVCRG